MYIFQFDPNLPIYHKFGRLQLDPQFWNIIEFLNRP